MIFRGATREPGGWDVLVEIPNAFSNGASRFDHHHITDRGQFAGLDPDGLAAALLAELEPDPLRQIQNLDLAVWQELSEVTPAPLAAVQNLIQNLMRERPR